MNAKSTDTTIDLMPNLRRIRVPAKKLILDPNNPRLLTHDNDRTDVSNFLDPGVSVDTHNKMMVRGAYQIKELEKSIQINGWQPVDEIFVRKYKDTENYAVQEGNRRVTAINNLLKLTDLDEEIKQSIDPLSVMEIVDDCDPMTLQVRINYLLGVRHHGSLKKWLPFAQAHNIYEQYIELARQSDETFQWEITIAQRVADARSIELKRVEERLRVYRVLKQIDSIPKVKKIGGIKGRYYSLCEEVLLKKGKSKLPDYIKQDRVTMLLDEGSLIKINNLCHFSEPGRDGAPISMPSEWRKFDKILQEFDETRRTEMIAEVEVEKRPPSAVWAKREVELFKPRWETWLREVSNILSRVQFGDDLDSPDAKAVGMRLGDLLAKLQTKIKSSGVTINERQTNGRKKHSTRRPNVGSK